MDEQSGTQEEEAIGEGIGESWGWRKDKGSRFQGHRLYYTVTFNFSVSGTHRISR